MHAVTRRHTLAAAIAVAIALAGSACSSKNDATMEAAPANVAAQDASAVASDSAFVAKTAAAPAAPRADGGAEEVKGLANHNGSQLAYTHDVQLRMPADHIAGNLGKVRDACNDQQFGTCDVLNEQLSAAGPYPSGELQMRAAPAAVAGLVKMAAEGGMVAERSTSAEDLAEAVRDNGMRRKRLEIQHAKLEEILEKGHGDMDQLVALTERLAALEAELNAADQEAAQQQRRINTNLLSLHFQAENVSVASETTTRIGDAFRGLTSTWDNIFAWMVSVFLGGLLPFVVVLAPVVWFIVRLARRQKPAAPAAAPASAR